MKRIVAKFTLHFATINTEGGYSDDKYDSGFTLHFATINTKDKYRNEFEITYLHYTLLLLIQPTIIHIF